MWWLAMAASSATAVSFAMWGCRYRELQRVFFGPARPAPAHADPPPRDPLPVDADEAVAARGSGRRRGPDAAAAAAPSYDMVPIKQAP